MFRAIKLSQMLAFVLLATLAITKANAQQTEADVLVYKSPTCGCCARWVDYLEDNGFQVETRDSTVMDEIKANLGLTDDRLKSCHTALVDGYIVERHVPVSDIRKLIAEKPPIKGLTAPGMPMNSPGMASIEPKGYDVYSFDKDGNIEIFSRY